MRWRNPTMPAPPPPITCSCSASSPSPIFGRGWRKSHWTRLRAAAPLKALKERNNLAEDVVDDVVLGVVDPVGEAGSDIARFAAIKAGLGESVPGVQISRFCASGLDAVNFAAAQIMSGQHELTIGGGAESMSRVVIGASVGAWPMDPSIAVPGYFMPQVVSADLIATKYRR